MNSFPFESKNTGTSAAPIWDRAITAEMERSFNKLRYTNGVFASPVNGLLIVAAGGMKVRVNPGGCHIEGALSYEPIQRDITLSPSSATLPRIDRIVCRFDTAEDKRNIEIYLKEGVPATTPSPQSIVRQSNYFEIVIADILVPKGATQITNSNITDQRMNGDLCGLVVPAIPAEQPTNELWQQISDSIDLVNSALDETIAGNLQGQITTLSGRMGTAETNITDMWKVVYPVGAIYMSTLSTSPATLFGGGTWVRILGRMLIGVDAADPDISSSEKTGGSKTHVLTEAEMPPHKHAYPVATVGEAGTARSVISGSTYNRVTSTAGGGQAHNNMPPFFAVYMWRRTA